MSSNGVFQDGATTMDTSETTHCPTCTTLSLSGAPRGVAGGPSPPPRKNVQLPKIKSQNSFRQICWLKKKKKVTQNRGLGSTRPPQDCILGAPLLSLSPIQTSVYHTLHDLIDKGEPKVILIDAPSGTGKTRILSTLAQNYSDGVQFAVFRRDQTSLVNAKTHFSFIMSNFNRTFDQVKSMFLPLNTQDNTDVLFELLTYAQKYASQSTKVIIMDDCTLMDPLMVLLLYIVSLKNEITLMFSGHRMQVGPIDKCPDLHSRSNFDVLELISDRTITELTGNMRSNDQSFLEKVAIFGNAIAGYKTKEPVPFHFNLRYLLYTLFREKFDPRILERCDALFMAQFHHVNKHRLWRIMRNMDPNKWLVTYFNRMELIGFILDKGLKYIYDSEWREGSVVVLEDMVFDPQTGDLTELVVRFEENGNRERIARRDLDYQLLPDYGNCLKEHMKLPRDIEPKICYFPLKPYTMTYDATFGRTISGNVELSTDCTDATTFYTGLCSLPWESNIHKFHAEQYLSSFVATDIMAAEDKETYYYRCPATGVFANDLLQKFWKNFGNENSDESLKDILKSVPWETVDDIYKFENNNDKNKLKYLKIKRSFYENDNIEVDTITDSPLMEITKFVKDEPHVVIDVIEKIQNLGPEEAKKVMVDAYEKWKVQQREADKK